MNRIQISWRAILLALLVGSSGGVFYSAAGAVEGAATPMNPSDEQVLKRWTPGGDTNVLDLPYRHRFADYERETDANWVDARWQQTDWGPFLTHATEVAGQPLRPKNVVLFLNGEKSAAAMFDLERCGVQTIAQAARLEIDPARFGLLRKPKLQGQFLLNLAADSMWHVAEHNLGDRKPAAVSYRGLRMRNSQVLLEYAVGEAAVAETIWLETGAPAGVFVRQVQVGPSAKELFYQVNVEIADAGAGQKAATVVRLIDAEGDPKSAVKLSGTMLHIPPREKPTTVTLVAWQGSSAGREGFDAWQREFKPPAEVEKLKQPGQRRWGEPLATEKVVSKMTDRPYVVDDFPLPLENRFKALFFCSSIEFFPDGAAAVCTAHGDVWIVRGLSGNENSVTWQRFATGLYQPLGLKVIDGKVIVLENNQLTRLHDLNGDCEADWYESLNHDLRTFGQDHAYAMRLETDTAGNFYFLKSGAPPHGSALYRLSSDFRKLERIASGFRHPFGLGVGPAGEITVADNEGNWVPSSKIDWISSGGFYGYTEGQPKKEIEATLQRPLCYLPKVADNSCGGQIWVTSDRWGDYHRGGMIHFSWGRGTMHAVLRQEVGGVHQAATVQYPEVQFCSGPADAAFNPVDGQLYVVGLDGWQTAATRDGCLSRVRFTGQDVLMPTAFAVHENGILLRFTQTLDAGSATKRESYRVNQWNYRRSNVYGSFHYSVAEPESVGHDGVAVDRASLLADGRSVFLHIRGLKPVDQIHVHTELFAKSGRPLSHDLYGTINAVAGPLEVNDGRDTSPFVKENLVAWCIVPFDAKNRGPAERVEMLKRLGIRRIAYDWRDHHIPQFDEELTLYKQHGIELVGFWTPVNSANPLDEPHVRCVLDALERGGMRTQLWVMPGEHLLRDVPEERRVEHVAKILLPLAEKARQLGCSVGLYNHGGWFGNVEHQIQIIKRLEKEAVYNVGMVYNLHHGHHELGNLHILLTRMQPYLYALNLNGMKQDGPKILPIGQGDDDGKLLQTIKNGGYRGPVGILNHQEQADAEAALRENLAGMERLSSTTRTDAK